MASNIERDAAENIAGNAGKGKNIIHAGLGYLIGSRLDRRGGGGGGRTARDFENEAKLEGYKSELRKHELEHGYGQSQQNARAFGTILSENPHIADYRDRHTSVKQRPVKKEVTAAEAEAPAPRKVTAEDTKFDVLSGGGTGSSTTASADKPARTNKVVATQTNKPKPSPAERPPMSAPSRSTRVSMPSVGELQTGSGASGVSITDLVGESMKSAGTTTTAKPAAAAKSSRAPKVTTTPSA